MSGTLEFKDIRLAEPVDPGMRVEMASGNGYQGGNQSGSHREQQGA
jgi:hypothetical protein